MSLFNKLKPTTQPTAKPQQRREILDSALTLEYLKADLGMLPHPYEPYNTIAPVEGGYYMADGKLYQYKAGELVEEKEEE